MLNDSPFHLDLYSEYMDTPLFPDPAVQQEFRDSYIRKYRNRKLDVIITVGPSPLKFMREVHQRAFPGVPIVFCLPALGVPGTPTVDSDFTGVENDMAPAETVGIALRLVPGTKNVVVVGGVSPVDREQQANIKEELKAYERRVDISYLTDFAMPDLLERLRRLPSNTVVLLASLGADAAGTSFKSNEAGPLVAGAANAPVFGLFDVYLNHGEVGGDLSSLSEQGEVAGGMALRILRGEKPQGIPKVKGVNTYMFDWRALKRWGIKESALPPGSIVLNRPPTVWESYKWYIISGIALILLEALLIGGLFWQRARRRKTEAELRKSEEKFSKSFHQSPLAVTITNMKDAQFIEVNEAFERDTGWKRDEVLGRTPLDLHLWERPEQRVGLRKQLLATGNVRDLEFKVRRKDGRVFTALCSADLIEVNGESCALFVAADITDRKMAEEALAGVSRQLIEAQEAERTRIARELHDDINQRLAMLAINLKTVKQDLPLSEAKTSHLIEEACAQVSDLEDDVQSLSHRLHSSGLEYLGLEAAVSDFCREVSERQNLSIHVRFDGVPHTLPHEASLCLFRVLQEAVHNAVKYSGVSDFEVSLTGGANELELSVHDSGMGFDPETARHSHGLGLTSMRERLRLVNGQLSIESKPQHGTTILARVPLNASMPLDPRIPTTRSVA